MGSNLDSFAASNRWSATLDDFKISKVHPRLDKRNDHDIVPWTHQTDIDIFGSYELFIIFLVLFGEATICHYWGDWIGSLWRVIPILVDSNALQLVQGHEANLEMDGILHDSQDNIGIKSCWLLENALNHIGTLSGNPPLVRNHTTSDLIVSRR